MTESGVTQAVDGQPEAFRVLVVEDDPVTRRLLEKLLQRSGYQVETAGNGREGLALFEAGSFSIAISDWMMPEMDGLQFCRAVRGHDQQRYSYIILLTARDSKDDLISGLEAGADDYLVKPIHPAELIARLNTARRILGLERSLRRRNEEIARLSITDSLTQVFNRGYFNQQLPAEIGRVRRHGGSLAIAICDIDHFKRVNDRYGHQAGDAVLSDFAHCLRDNVRQRVDWVARYGGEEFVLVLPETDLAGALLAAERFRSLVAETCVLSAAGSISITASFGVAVLNADTDARVATMDRLVFTADECLYEAKRHGRNRVVGRALEAGHHGQDGQD